MYSGYYKKDSSLRRAMIILGCMIIVVGIGIYSKLSKKSEQVHTVIEKQHIKIIYTNKIVDEAEKFIKQYQPVNAKQKQILYKYLENILDEEINLEERQLVVLLSLIFNNKGGYKAFDQSRLKASLKSKNLDEIVYNWLDFNRVKGKPSCKQLQRRLNELLHFYNITEDTIDDPQVDYIHREIAQQLNISFSHICYYE